MDTQHPLPAGAPSSASYSVFPDDYRVPFQKRRLIGIPESLFQFYNSPLSRIPHDPMLTPIYSYGCCFTYGTPLRNREGLGCNRPQAFSLGLRRRVCRLSPCLNRAR
jgi:hypothetical protein